MVVRPVTSVAALVALTAAVLVACTTPARDVADRPATGMEALPVRADQPRGHVVTGISGLSQVAQVTGPDSPNATDTVAIAGTDLGSMFTVGDRTYFVFGDTFGERGPDAFGGGGTNWRSNALAWTTDDDPTDGITLDGWVVDDVGLAAELLPSKKRDGEEMTKIPTHGFAVGDVLYLAYMSVRRWGEPGEWDVNYSSLARSSDQGRTWELLDDVRWPGDSNFVQVAVQRVADEDGPHLYFWSIPAGRSGGVQLMRVDEREVEDPAAYSYFAGTSGDEPRWVQDADEAETIVEGGVGEPSVIWNEALGRWLMTYQQDNADAVLSESPTPWGPWSEPHLLASIADQPGLYAPFMNQRYLSEDGKQIWFSLSLWGPYNVFWYSADLETST